MDVGAKLKQITDKLAAADIESARLDALLLLEDATNTSRAHLLAHPELILTPDQLVWLDNALVRRTQHIPLAYIRGEANFYGRIFTVNENVLVPRPETEVMVSLALEIIKNTPHPMDVADIGTGSGCIAISIKLEAPRTHVYGYDIDEVALLVARGNAQTLRADVHFAQRDLLAGNQQSYTLIMTNLPYVPVGYPINQAASHEPTLALFSGTDGLNLYRTFWAQIKQQRAPQPRYVLTESLGSQHKALALLAEQTGYTLQKTEGLIQLFTK